MPYTEYTIPMNGTVLVNGVLWGRNGDDIGPLFPMATLALRWDSSRAYDFTSKDPDMASGRSLTLQGNGANGWYDLWRGSENDLPENISLLGLNFFEARVIYTLRNGCEYYAAVEFRCDPVATMAAVREVATVDRVTIEAQGPVVGDTYLVTSGNPNVWESGQVVTWNGAGWDMGIPADGTVIQVVDNGNYWVVSSGQVVPIIPPLHKTPDEEGLGFTLVSMYPSVNAGRGRRIKVTAMVGGDEVTLYHGDEEYFAAPRHFDIGAYSSIAAVYDDGPCAWVVEIVEDASVLPGPPQGNLNGPVYAVRIDTEGRVVLGGAFGAWTLPLLSMLRITRLLPDLSPDTKYVSNTGTGLNSYSYAVEIDALGRSVVGGEFTTINGTPSNRLARILPDGTPDTTLDIGSGFEGDLPVWVYGIAIASDGTIICVGRFSVYNGTPAVQIVALSPDGNIETSWDFGTGFNGSMHDIILCANGDIVVAGSFTTYNSIALIPSTPGLRHVVRLHPDGSVNMTFGLEVAFNGMVSSVIELPDGRFIMAGLFTTYNGQPAKHVAVIRPDATLDMPVQLVFNSSPDIGHNNRVLYDPVDDKIYLAGTNTINGPSEANRVMRFRMDGTRDTGFRIGSGTTGEVTTMRIDPISRTLVACGNFTSFNNQPRHHVVRLSI